MVDGYVLSRNLFRVCCLCQGAERKEKLFFRNVLVNIALNKKEPCNTLYFPIGPLLGVT